MSKKKDYDFCGWATKNDLRCSDGRMIMKDAFKSCDGQRVPLVWNHDHKTPEGILGHALLENRNEGVYAYCKFNETESGQNARMLVEHGDVSSLSIYANQLKEQGRNVIHGLIREVSLVLAGANPGAYIDSVIVHADGSISEDNTQGTIFTGEDIELFHGDIEEVEEQQKKEESINPEKQENEEIDVDESNETIGDVLKTFNDDQQNLTEMLIQRIVNDNDDAAEDEDKEELQKIYDSLNEKQKIALNALLEETIQMVDEDNEDTDDEDTDDENIEEEKENNMKHNVFENEERNTVLSHADGESILNMAKSYGGGSLKAAMEIYARDNNIDLMHADLGFNNVSTLFPEYKDVRPGAPETVSKDQGWITAVLSRVHKSPISRIRTRQADLREATGRRGLGYKKGTKKKEIGNISLLSRTTDPCTVYVKSKLDRDDIIDITDFDVVQYMYGIDRQNLNEELATAIMVGDGREQGDANKIDETKIRPVWGDDELYTIHADVDFAKMKAELQGTNTGANFGENYIYAEAIIQTLLYAREGYKGSGSPDFFCTPHVLNVMLLARDLNGRRVYDNVNELKAALNVREIITVEQFDGLERKTVVNTKETTKKLLGIMYNLEDYSLGATKGGEISHFTDFDINFNQQVSLLETRVSGANTRVLSAIALEETVATA